MNLILIPCEDMAFEPNLTPQNLARMIAQDHVRRSQRIPPQQMWDLTLEKPWRKLETLQPWKFLHHKLMR